MLGGGEEEFYPITDDESVIINVTRNIKLSDILNTTFNLYRSNDKNNFQISFIGEYHDININDAYMHANLYSLNTRAFDKKYDIDNANFDKYVKIISTVMNNKNIINSIRYREVKLRDNRFKYLYANYKIVGYIDTQFDYLESKFPNDAGDIYGFYCKFDDFIPFDYNNNLDIDKNTLILFLPEYIYFVYYNSLDVAYIYLSDSYIEVNKPADSREYTLTRKLV